MTIYTNFNKLEGYYTACIGFFDGVHRGHRFLIDHLRMEARKSCTDSAVITFINHPRKLVQPDFDLQLIHTLDERLNHLSATGIDACFLLEFTPSIRNLTAQAFLTEVVARQLHVRQLLIGYDHRFGRNRAECFDDYVRYGALCGVRVMQEPVFDDGRGLHYSSSEIRKALHSGQIRKATALLGGQYSLGGVVIAGHKIGRKLGFPTANLQLEHPEKIIPCDGVYAVKAVLSSGQMFPAMLNIGVRPTVDSSEHKRTLEVYLIGFEGDLYGQRIELQFVDRMRDELKMASLEVLQAQLAYDRREAERIVLEDLDQ